MLSLEDDPLKWPTASEDNKFFQHQRPSTATPSEMLLRSLLLLLAVLLTTLAWADQRYVKEWLARRTNRMILCHSLERYGLHAERTATCTFTLCFHTGIDYALECIFTRSFPPFRK